MVKCRGGFTLIELIFAIVLIAIVVTAVPQMLSQNEKGTETYLTQEVIAAAAGEAFRIISYPWDASSVDDTNRSMILDATTSGNLARTGLPIRVGGVVPLKGSAGNVDRYYHRRFFNTVMAPSGAILEGINHIDASLLSDQGRNAYKSTYTISFPTNENGYIADGNGAAAFVFPDTNGSASASTNMKMATVQVDSPSQNNLMKLRVYAANIGSAEFYTRDF